MDRKFQMLSKAISEAGVDLKNIDENLIRQATETEEYGIKLELFKQWKADSEEKKKKAEEELGSDFQSYFGWGRMPLEKAIKILSI